MLLSELKDKIVPKIALYGRPASGKTAFALSWGSQTEVIDCDPVGVGVGLKLEDRLKPERLQAEIFQAKEDNPKLAVAFNKVKSRLYSISEEAVRGTYKRKVLVLDSLTALGDYAKRSILANSGSLEKNANLTLQQWGLALNELEQCLTIVKSLPLAVIVVGHLMVQEMDSVNMAKMWVIGAKLPDQLPAFFNEIWYSDVKPAAGGAVDYKLQTRLSPSIMARTQGNLPDGFNMSEGLQKALATIGYEPAIGAKNV